MRIIPVADGRNFVLDPLAKAVPVGSEGLLLDGVKGCHLVEVDFEGCISSKTASWLEEQDYGFRDDISIFGQIALAKALFGWDASVELEGLQTHLAGVKHLLGLDVGCGYGRLLIPLTREGYQIDGIDQSFALIKDLNDNLAFQKQSRAFCVRMEEYISPGAYAYAYAAMNTIRYLQTKFSFLRHFRCMRENLQPNGIYLFCISLVPEPNKPYDIKWQFEYENQKYEIHWSFHSYCYLSEQITEKIEIWKTKKKQMIHREYQIQGFYPLSLLEQELWAEKKDWILEAIYDLCFHPIRITKDTRGTFWFKIRSR
ncbi:MAG: class I SAM-dependent methyltransferase [Acidobacteria bacterium]|nr:class I SAM-dependent methyltransferase [Acidobacteriota bacterium]